MSLPLSIILYDRGASGVPTTDNPVNIAGRVESYADSIHDRYGYESAQVAWKPSKVEVLEWLRPDNLMRPVEVYAPTGARMWEGFLSEITLTIGQKKISYSIGAMANRIVVHYDTDAGGLGATSTYSSSASIALFGTKDRLLNASKVSAAAAANRAQTALAEVAFPKSKQASEAGTGGNDGIALTLTFAGWYTTLDWLLTTSTSTSSTVTSTQVVNLLTTYNATNNWFSTSAAAITATGLSDTEYIDADTTYRDKIETLLAHGNSSQQLLAWGVYDNRTFSIQTSARATPSTITYYESAQSGLIFDAYRNVVPAWDVRPNAMAQVIDLIDAALAGAAESPTTKYVGRVRRKFGGGDESITLEPSDVEDIISLIANPAGAGPAGTSERQAKFESKILRPTRTRVPSDTGSGGVVTPPVSGGTAGRLMQWAAGGRSAADSNISATGAGSLTIESAAAAMTLKIWGGGEVNLYGGQYLGVKSTTQLDGYGTSGPAANDVLAWDGSFYAPKSLSAAGGAPVGAKYIVQQADATLTNEQALGALASGLLKNTTTTGVLSIATAGTDYLSPGDAAPVDAKYIVQTSNGTLTNEQALSSLSSGVMKVTTTTGVVSSMTGTSSRLVVWSDAATLGASTLIKGSAGVLTLDCATTETLTIASGGGGTLDLDGGTLTLSANLTTTGAGNLTLAAAGAYTLTIPATGTAALGTGTNTRLAYWSGTNTLTSDAGLTFDGELHLTGRYWSEGAGAGYALDDRDGSGQWLLYVTGNAFYVSSTVTGGTNLIGVSTSAITPASGSSVDLGSPFNTFDAIYGTTLRLGSTQVLGARKTGWAAASGTATRTSFATSTVTTQQLAERVKALIDDLISHGAIGA